MTRCFLELAAAVSKYMSLLRFSHGPKGRVTLKLTTIKGPGGGVVPHGNAHCTHAGQPPDLTLLALLPLPLPFPFPLPLLPTLFVSDQRPALQHTPVQKHTQTAAA